MEIEAECWAESTSAAVLLALDRRSQLGERERDEQLLQLAHCLAYKWQAGRQADRQADRQTGRQAVR